MTATVSDAEMGPSHEFALTRLFDAPRDVVWRAWSEAEGLAAWWGPKGFKMEVKRLDFRPGGLFHYRLVSEDGQTMWARFLYREIVAPERIVFVNSFSDEAGGVTRAPFAETWPLEMLTTVVFTAQGKRTAIALAMRAINADHAEQATFDSGFESMSDGFGGTFDQLVEYLAKV